MNDASPTVSEMITVEYTEYVAIVAMVHRPYNLSGPDLYRSLLDAFEAAMKAGSRAILLKSGLRHFCAGADVSLWDERIANQVVEVMGGVLTPRVDYSYTDGQWGTPYQDLGDFLPQRNLVNAELAYKQAKNTFVVPTLVIVTVDETVLPRVTVPKLIVVDENLIPVP